MKKIISTIIVCVMLAVTALACTACTVGGKFGKMTVTITYYSLNTDTGAYTATEETETVSVKLYKHFAPNTVDRVKTLANENFFNGAVFYKNASYSSQVMVGDLYYGDNGFSEKRYDKYLTATEDNPYAMEFEKGGVKGIDLTATNGYVGLWRDFSRNSKLTYTDSSTFGLGCSTLFLPTGTTSYTGYFAIFGKLDQSFIDFMDDIKADLSDSDDYTSYTVYSVAVEENGVAKTGEDDLYYVLDDNAPVFNILPTEDLGSIKGYDTYVAENEDESARTENTDLWVNTVKYYIPVKMAVVTSVKVK